MKKQIFFPAFLVAIFLWSGNIQAQVEDVANPLLKYVNRNNGLRFTAGGRLFTDVAYYHSEYTPMKSGAAITDARIRTSLKYKQFYFYADFDFSKGSFKQKNIFGQYNFKENYRGVQSVKAGYFCEPSTMAYNTSLYNYHFIPVRQSSMLWRLAEVWGLLISFSIRRCWPIRVFLPKINTMIRSADFRGLV